MTSLADGGSPPASMGGDSAGGTASGGAPAAPSLWDRLPTTGCGQDPGQPLGQYTRYEIPLDGETLDQPHSHTMREIFVWLPPNYDSNRAYRVIYITVGCQAPDGASAAYPLMDTAQGGEDEAIYVALSLPDPPTNNNCYDNRAGVNSIDWESFDHDHAFVASHFCVDDNRVFTGGYSAGGWISNMYSCYFGGIPDPPRKFAPGFALRGAMGVSGGWVEGNPECNGPVAALWIHDEGDGGANPISGAYAMRDRVLEQNGCQGGSGGPTEVWGADVVVNGTCLKYTACPAEYPVVFCTTQGQGHASQNSNAIRGFNRFMDDLEPENMPAE
jgi:hypothetical protein